MLPLLLKLQNRAFGPRTFGLKLDTSLPEVRSTGYKTSWRERKKKTPEKLTSIFIPEHERAIEELRFNFRQGRLLWVAQRYPKVTLNNVAANQGRLCRALRFRPDTWASFKWAPLGTYHRYFCTAKVTLNYPAFLGSFPEHNSYALPL